MREYKPYETESFLELMKAAYNLGWYGGQQVLFNIEMKGAFEGWSGRATESWEHRFFISAPNIYGDNKSIIWNGFQVEGETLDEACKKALSILKSN